MLPTVYTTISQSHSPALFVAMRIEGNPAAASNALRQVVPAVDRQLDIEVITTLEEEVEASVRTERMLSKVTGIFGILALILVSTGIYAIVSYSVSGRTREFGIRMALGATPRSVRSMVLREVLLLTGVGILAGLPVAVAAGKLIEKLLFGVQAADSVSLGAAAVLPLAVASIAAWIPARKASLIDPMTALHWE